MCEIAARMEIWTVKQCINADDKDVVPAIQVTLDRVYPSEKKKGYELQNMEVSDSTGKIRLTNWGEPLPKSDEGEEFLIESHEGKKGLSGVYITFYNGKNKLNISENAKIKSPGGKPSGRQGSRGNAQDYTKGVTEPPRKSAPPDPAEVAQRAARGWEMALELAIASKDASSHEWSDSMLQAAAGWIYGQMKHENVIQYIKIEKPEAPPRRDEPAPPPVKRDGNPRSEPDDDEIPF